MTPSLRIGIAGIYGLDARDRSANSSALEEASPRYPTSTALESRESGNYKSLSLAGA